jgi:hypothetical protein
MTACSIVHWLKEYDRTLIAPKKIESPFSEAFYKEVPRLRQHPLTPLGGRGHPGHSQHPSHTGEQHRKLRQFFFSRLTRNKWQ